MRQGQRLTEGERAKLRRRTWGGETYARAAVAVGCSTRSIHRVLGGPRALSTGRLAAGRRSERAA